MALLGATALVGFVPPVVDAPLAGAQAAQAPLTPSANPSVVPFKTGEKLDYEVRIRSFKVGQGTMEVRGIEDVRGRDTWHAVFAYSGALAFYKVNDRHESWFDLADFSTRRFHQDIDEGSYERTRRYEIFPERGMMREGANPEVPTPQMPLDETSFLYFVRTLPLAPNATYTFSRYFKAEGNPVRIQVLRRERITVPAGTFNTIVVRPTFQTRGLFSEGGKAEVWISDDAARVVVQLKSQVPVVGALNLYLKSHNTAAGK